MAAHTARLLSLAPVSAVRRALAGALLLIFALPVAAPDAQSLYRYRAPDGQWVFSDRLPPAADLAAVEAVDERGAAIRLQRGETAAGDAVLVAVNELGAWAQIAFRIESARNLDPDARTEGNALLPPGSMTELMGLPPLDGVSEAEVSVAYQYIYGHPGARHEPEQPYRLPYALASAYLISQAYPEIVTHADLANRYAVDFEMPIGTSVFAARDGLVVEVAGGFSEAGLDLERDRGRANFVRVLHDDGTLALYGHLSRASIRVTPGQRVVRGQHIADSGNTGFSSGPHLHFVVQRNRAGEVESVPVSFAGVGEALYTPHTGDRPIAY